MAKNKRDDKKARREQEKAEREAAKATELAAEARRRGVLIGIPILALLTAAALHWGFALTQFAGATLLAGALIWLVVALGFLGSAIPPKNRARASAIDFGNQGRGQ